MLTRLCLTFLLTAVAVMASSRPAHAYVEVPITLADVIKQSTHVVQMRVTKVDREKNLIIYTKVADIKGKHPQTEIKHNIGRGGLRPGEWQEIMKWAEVGKSAVFFHNGGASETFIGVTWYQAYPQGEWWGMSHAEPFLLRSYAGKVDKLPGYVAQINEGKEVIVPCMVDGDKEALHKKTARIQRLKTSLKNIDYNPRRDFVGWGGEDIRALKGMPGFDKYAALTQLDAEAQSVTSIDFDDDGKPDICLCGAGRVALLQNGGDGFVEVPLPGLTLGARAAVWADCNADGLPDLLLATPTGPRLFVNWGGGQFRDETRRLPKELAYNLTTAAWGDFDGDGRPDILLANGFHGLRLYRNIRSAQAAAKEPSPKFGDWHAIGPFRAPSAADNFKTAFAVESEPFNPQKEYAVGNAKLRWVKKGYADKTINSLAEFGDNSATYLHREIEVNTPVELPVSLGSDDTITVWLNGQQVLSENVNRACAADQNRTTLKLKAGKNSLLIKICNGTGDYAFYFAAGEPAVVVEPWFADVSSAWGLGPAGLAHDAKGDALAVADFTGDGKLDFLYSAGTGMLLVNHNGKFVHKADSGINFKAGKVGPTLCDFDGDGHTDLFVPQTSGPSKLYRNDGTGKFTDTSAGDLSKPIAGAVGAAWGDFDNDGKPDVVVCCLRGCNRYFQNAGNGQFIEKTSDIGLTRKVFNSQAAALADLNADGQLDLILNNEAQESSVLFGSATPGKPLTPVVVKLNGSAALNGGRVVVKDASGKAVASCCVAVCDARGGQCGLAPRFVLAPGAYKIEIIGTDGQAVTKDVTVANSPVNVKVN